MVIPQIIYSTIANKCPRCHKGRIFEKNNPYTFDKPLLMHDSCSECDLRYEREPGFFYGAMYVSYAMMSGIFITWFISDLLWLHMEALTLAVSVMLNILIAFPIVYRSARIVWLNFFIRYDKDALNKKTVLIKCENGKFKEEIII